MSDLLERRWIDLNFLNPYSLTSDYIPVDNTSFISQHLIGPDISTLAVGDDKKVITFNFSAGIYGIGPQFVDSVSGAGSANDVATTEAMVDYVQGQITLEDFWDRTGTLIHTKNSGDKLQIDGGIGSGVDPLHPIHVSSAVSQLALINSNHVNGGYIGLQNDGIGTIGQLGASLAIRGAGTRDELALLATDDLYLESATADIILNDAGRVTQAGNWRIGRDTAYVSEDHSIQAITDESLRLIGPNTNGSGFKLLWGDAFSVWIQETVDDQFTMHAELGMRYQITNGVIEFGDNTLADGTGVFTSLFTLNPTTALVTIDGSLQFSTGISINKFLDEDLMTSDDPAAGASQQSIKSYVDTTVSAGASIQITWKFSTSTTAADPGSKLFRYDNATPANVTNIYVSDTTEAGADASILLSTLEVGDRIYLQQTDDSGAHMLALVSGAPIDNTGWWTIPVTIDDSGTLPVNNKKCGWILLYSANTSTSLWDRAGTVVSPINAGDSTRTDGGLSSGRDISAGYIIDIYQSTGLMSTLLETGDTSEISQTVKNTAGSFEWILKSDGDIEFNNGINQIIGIAVDATKLAIDISDNAITINPDAESIDFIVYKDVVGEEALWWDASTGEWELNGNGISGEIILDEDDMVSDSDTHLATQQSIKAYSDSFFSMLVNNSVPIWNVVNKDLIDSGATITSSVPGGVVLGLTPYTTLPSVGSLNNGDIFLYDTTTNLYLYANHNGTLKSVELTT